jgi:hypothetical protein
VDSGVPAVSAHGSGFIAVWADDAVDAIRFATRGDGAPNTLAWTPGADLLSAAGTNTFQPRVVAVPSGNAVALWLRGTNPWAVESALRDLEDPVAGALDVPAAAVAGEPVAMSMPGTDAWSGVQNVLFSFGDLTGAIVTPTFHAWAMPGTYPVTATVTDRAGRQASRTQPIVISAPPAPPVVTPPPADPVPAPPPPPPAPIAATPPAAPPLIPSPRALTVGAARLTVPGRLTRTSLRTAKCVNVRARALRPATVTVRVFSGIRSLRLFGQARARFTRPATRVLCIAVPARARTFAPRTRLVIRVETALGVRLAVTGATVSRREVTVPLTG